jgi:hypothetical protein
MNGEKGLVNERMKEEGYFQVFESQARRWPTQRAQRRVGTLSGKLTTLRSDPYPPIRCHIPLCLVRLMVYLGQYSLSYSPYHPTALFFLPCEALTFSNRLRGPLHLVQRPLGQEQDGVIRIWILYLRTCERGRPGTMSHIGSRTPQTSLCGNSLAQCWLSGLHGTFFGPNAHRFYYSIISQETGLDCYRYRSYHYRGMEYQFFFREYGLSLLERLS